MKFCSLILLCMLFISCGADEETGYDISDNTPTGTYSTLGEKKRQITNDSAAAAPQMPTASRPSVSEVGYYSDWRLTKPLTERVSPGETIYTKVVFSQPMRHIASDAGNARPILSFLINRKATRYRIKPHGARAANFQAGDCKPLGSGTDDYVCKYTVGANDAGTFTLKVGRYSNAEANNKKLATSYTHDTTLQLRSVTGRPKVVSMTYYSSQQATEETLLRNTVTGGTAVYTEVVFSDDVSLHVSDDPFASPRLWFNLGGSQMRYHVVPEGSIGDNFQSGDCRPTDGTRVFLCKVTIPRSASGYFYTIGEGFLSPTLSVQQLAPDTFVPFSPRGEYINPAPEHDERINEVLDKELNYMLRVRVVDVDRAEQLWVIGIEEEFRIGYTEAIRDELITIYREELDMPFVETEYLRLSLAYPDKKPRKLLSMLRASLRHSVDYGMTYRQLVRRYTYQRSRANYNNANLQIDLIEQIFNLDLSEISGNGNKDRRTSLRHSSTFDSYIRLAFEYPEKSYDEIVAHLDAGYRIKYWELL